MKTAGPELCCWAGKLETLAWPDGSRLNFWFLKKGPLPQRGVTSLDTLIPLRCLYSVVRRREDRWQKEPRAIHPLSTVT